MNDTPIVVVGGGSLGLLLAGRLNAAGVRAELWTRAKEQAGRIRREGIALVESVGAGAPAAAATVSASASAIDSAAKPPPGAAVLLAVKQTALTEELLRRLRELLSAEHLLIAFCNGIGHFDRLHRHMPEVPLSAAVTTEAALRGGPRSVTHTGRGHTWLGPAPLFETAPPRYVQTTASFGLEAIESRLKPGRICRFAVE